MKDSSRHVILGVQQFKPAEFGAQINLSMDNAWGIVRCIVDLVRKQKDGKYLIVKDPMKPVIRLYDIPDSTFESEDESDDEDEGKGPRGENHLFLHGFFPDSECFLLHRLREIDSLKLKIN